MVDFSDINNDKSKSGKEYFTVGKSREKDSTIGKSMKKNGISFKDIVTDDELLKDVIELENVINKDDISKVTTNEEKTHELNIVDLYERATIYMGEVFKFIREGTSFSIEPGFDIISKIVDANDTNDPLFIKAIYFDSDKEYIITHSVNVAIYSIKMADALGWSRENKIEIGMTGLLHDVSMGLIPDELIYKQERLSDDEFKKFQERPNNSFKILQEFNEDYPYIAESALQIYERMNGSGYPRGLEGEEINEYAQIIGLVDIYEALIHSRPQREKFLHFLAVKEIIKTCKYNFQRKHLKLLLNIFSIFPLLSYVKLNSGAIGKVIETYPDQPMRPKLQIILDSQHRKVLTERIINLPENSLLYLVDSIAEEDIQNFFEASEKKDYLFEKTDNVVKSDETSKKETIIIGENINSISIKDSRWFKYALPFGALILLLLGVIWQYGSSDSEVKVPEKKLSQPEVKLINKNATDKQTDKQKVNNRQIIKPVINETIIEKEVIGNGNKGEVKALEKTEQETTVNTTIQKKDNIKKVQNYIVDNKDFAHKNLLEEPRIVNKTNNLADNNDIIYNTKAVDSSETIIKNTNYPYSALLITCRTLVYAEKKIEFYKKNGISSSLTRVDLGKDGIFFRVFSGYFENKEQAGKFIEDNKLKKGKIKRTKYSTLIKTFSSEGEISFTDLKEYSPYILKRNDRRYELLLGAFYTKIGAENLCAELKLKGIPCEVIER